MTTTRSADSSSPEAILPGSMPMELVCPAGSLPALKAAVDNGADCVYLGFRDATNARNFAGLSFDDAIQRQSPLVYNLVCELEPMRTLGVDVVRISPQSQHTDLIMALFHAVLNNGTGAAEALRQMESLMPDRQCDGYWHGKPGLDRVAI